MKIYQKKVNRSLWGNISVFLFVFICAAFMSLPLIFAITSAFKPLNELWLYPPRLYVVHPTLKNFSDLFALLSNSWVPFSRYFFNTAFITAVGTAGNVLVASMCAYPLAKYKIPGSKAFFSIIVLSLMFNTSVTDIPNYLTMSFLGWINSYQALIVPAIGSSLGLYLMKQFMEQIPDSLIEAAKIDGAGHWRTFIRIIMPNVKPAWLTLIVFSVQGLWNIGNTNFIYSEQLKTLPYALNQIISGGIARAGVGSAVAVILLIVPISVFIFTQSNIIETMSSSGIKE